MVDRTELTPRQTWTPGFRGFESRRLLNPGPFHKGSVVPHTPAPLHKEPPLPSGAGRCGNSNRPLDHNPGIGPLSYDLVA